MQTLSERLARSSAFPNHSQQESHQALVDYAGHSLVRVGKPKSDVDCNQAEDPG